MGTLTLLKPYAIDMSLAHDVHGVLIMLPMPGKRSSLRA